MTKENECVGSYEVSGYTRQDGTEVSGYTRRCGAKHVSQDDKYEKRADVLYPSMNKVLQGGVEYDYYPEENEPQEGEVEGNEYPEEESPENGASKKEIPQKNKNVDWGKIFKKVAKGVGNVKTTPLLGQSKFDVQNTKIPESSERRIARQEGDIGQRSQNRTGKQQGNGKTQKDYEEIANVLYPTMSDNKAVEILKEKGKQELSEIEKERWKEHAKNIVNIPSILKEEVGTKLNHIKNVIAVDHIDKYPLKKYAISEKGKETAENLHMSKTDSYMNTDYAKQHTIHDNYLSVDSKLQSYFKDKITQQIGEDKLLTTKGIEIAADTESSKRLSDVLQVHESFVKNIVANIENLQKGISFDTSIRFVDKNFNYALGNVDIRDIHINKDGDLELIVCDTYDFNKDDPSDIVQVAYDRQLKGEITPYFIIYHVIIPRKRR